MTRKVFLSLFQFVFTFRLVNYPFKSILLPKSYMLHVKNVGTWAIGRMNAKNLQNIDLVLLEVPYCEEKKKKLKNRLN